MAYLTPEEHAQVSAAVAAAEAQTSGEIVTVLAERSDGYSDIALVWSAFAAFTALAVAALFSDFFLAQVDALFGGWNHEWTPAAVLWLAVAIAIIIFAAAWAFQLWQSLKFALVPGLVKTDRVRDRAIELFKVGAERRTHGRTGVLIYLSLREHRAEIVADAPIAAKVTPEVWGEAMADMLMEIKQGRIAAGMAAGVADVGGILAEHFPRAEDDRNELPDRLIEV